MLSKDEIEGKGRQVIGTIKENLGWLTADHQAEGEGKANRIAGEAQHRDAKVIREAEEAASELDIREVKLEQSERSAVVAIYETHNEAEEAIRDIQKSGFDMQKLSIVGKDHYTEEEVVGYYTTGDRMKAWGKTGAFWGGLWGMLFGAAVFMIPGIGPLLAAGPLVEWILAALAVGALEGAVVVGGLSALGAGLYSIGIPEDSVIEYETHVKAGKYVVIAHGSLGEVSKIQGVFAATHHQGVQEHAYRA